MQNGNCQSELSGFLGEVHVEAGSETDWSCMNAVQLDMLAVRLAVADGISRTDSLVFCGRSCFLRFMPAGSALCT